MHSLVIPVDHLHSKVDMILIEKRKKKKRKRKSEKVYLKSQIVVHEYWAILDHICVPSFWKAQRVLKNVNITFSGNTGTPTMFQYSPIQGRSSIWDLKYTFSRKRKRRRRRRRRKKQKQKQKQKTKQNKTNKKQKTLTFCSEQLECTW